MKAFQYVTAQTPQSATELAADGGRYFAGGIDLLGELKEYLVEAKTLVNVKALPQTCEIAATADKLIIGANVNLVTLSGHADVKKLAPGLADAAGEVGSPQIRNVATVGGNLGQHSRCWYYRHRDVQCLKKGGSTCYALEGENKFHALFTGNPCVSPVVSNLATMLTALDATVFIQRGNKLTALPIAALYDEAWKNPLAHNSLQPGDLILRVEVPLSAGSRSAYLQMSEKSSFDWALVSCGVSAEVHGKTLHNPRIALGVVSPVPHTSDAANDFLHGKELNDETATQAAGLLLQGAKPLEHNGYKIPLATALTRRALMKLIA